MESLLNLMTGGLIIFLAYEGFELIANTAQDVEDPEKTLPKAFYAAVSTTIFIYVLVSIVKVANVSYEDVQKYQDYVLAVAAKPFLGKAGFILIGIAALLSTSSAINATLYGSARVSYLIAKFGELPKNLTKNIWKHGTEGLLIGKYFNCRKSGIFFSFVNLANFKLSKYTDSNPFIPLAGFLVSLVSIITLISYNLKTNPNSLASSFVVLVLTFLFEVAYRFFTDVRLKETVVLKNIKKKFHPPLKTVFLILKFILWVNI
ncbi:APC family permease [Lebetimonas sp. JH292]|uniref:APC family permease n=1 Tax=Lebetimonas sp. JH292 TaxID=990068 RepID=UPI001F39CCB1|nr:APC family permease [Lebetimonas sp. JH292]